MVLTTGTVQTIVNHASNSQYLVLKVTPASAVVELNNEILPTVDGVAHKLVKLGSYEYRVQAPNYHTSAGIVTIDDPDNKKVLEVNLAPAFGWVDVSGHKDYDGAQVFVDNALIGTIPIKSKELSSGEHNMKIVKPLYFPFSQTFIIKDNETTMVFPELLANFSEVTITVNNNAEIFVNDEKKGLGTWTGRLAPGNYRLVAKKKGHRSITQNAEIVSSQPEMHISLPSPIPIYGEVNVTSTPAMADVFIDGELFGKTPLYLSKLLVGNHQIMIKQEGYSPFISSFENTENHRTDISPKLVYNQEIEIVDDEVKRICLAKWDYNNDGKFTKDEAKQVDNLNKAFRLNMKIRNLNILHYFENLRRLNSEEFYLCSSLEEISLPSGLVSIGDSVFVKCRVLKEIELPPSVVRIGHGIIEDCSKLKSISIPASVNSIKGIRIPWDTIMIFDGNIPNEMGHIYASPSSTIKVRKEYYKNYKSHPAFKLSKKQIIDY